MLKSSHFKMPKQLGDCLNASAVDIIKMMGKNDKSFCGTTLAYKQAQIKVSAVITVVLDIVNEDTVKFTIVDHDVLLIGKVTPMDYLNTLHRDFELAALMDIAHPLAVSINLLKQP